MPLTRVVTDTFSGGVDVPITSHVSDTGQTWNNWNGAVRVRTTGDASNASTSSGNRANVNEPVGGPYFDVSAAITVPDNSDWALFAGVTGRHSAASGIADGYEFAWENSTNEYRLHWQGGTDILVPAAPPPPGTVLTLRFRATIVEALVNGAVVASTTVQLNPTSQVAGFFVGAFASGFLDTVRADNFTVDLWTEDPSGIEGVGVGSYGYGASGTGSVVPLATLTVALMEGATEIASWDLTPDAMTTDELTLTTPQRDAITDWSALELVLSHSGDFARSRVEFAQIETPPLILPVEGVGVAGYGYGAVGTGTVDGAPASVGTSSGSSTAIGVARVIVRSVGLAAGVASAVAVGAVETSAVGSAAGQSTATGVSRVEVRAAGASAGASAVSGVAAIEVRASGASAGLASASGVSVVEVRSAGTAGGTSTALGVGADAAAGASVGTAAGTSSAVGVARVEVRSVGTASGTSTATGVGALGPGLAVGLAEGTSTAVGVALVEVRATGVASGASVAIGSGAVEVRAVGVAVGSSTASGVGMDGAAQLLNPMEIRLTRAPSIAVSISRAPSITIRRTT